MRLLKKLSLVLIGVIAFPGVPRHIGAQLTVVADPLAFDRADRRSRQLIWTMLCAQRVAVARQDGLFGPADSLGRSGQCMRLGGRAIGVFLQVDSQFVRPSRFSAVDLAARTRVNDVLDTAAILAVSRAQRTAFDRGIAPFVAAKRQFIPVAFRFDGDTIELWLLPASNVLAGGQLSAGGEVGFVFSPDGRRVVREINNFDKYRMVPVPDTGEVHIASGEMTIPALSELVLANVLNRAGRQVWIDMRADNALLSGRDSQAVWVHMRKSPD